MCFVHNIYDIFCFWLACYACPLCPFWKHYTGLDHVNDLCVLTCTLLSLRVNPFEKNTHVIYGWIQHDIVLNQMDIHAYPFYFLIIAMCSVLLSNILLFLHSFCIGEKYKLSSHNSVSTMHIFKFCVTCS